MVIIIKIASFCYFYIFSAKHYVGPHCKCLSERLLMSCTTPIIILEFKNTFIEGNHNMIIILNHNVH